MGDGAGSSARVGVRHRHQVVIGCGHRQLEPAAKGSDEGGEAVRAAIDAGPPAQPAQRDPVPAEAQRAHRGPRRAGRTDPDPGEHQFQPRLRRGGEVRGVQPHPRIGMLGSPVVADGSPPPGHGDLAAVDLEPAGDLAIRDGRLQLGTRQRRTVQRRRTQRPQRRLPAGDSQLPAGGVLSHRGLPAEPLRPGGSVGREGAEDLLDHGRRLIGVAIGVTIEDRAPQGYRLRPLTGAMTGVAYPQRPGGAGIASADEPRFISAGAHLPIMPSRRLPLTY